MDIQIVVKKLNRGYAQCNGPGNYLVKIPQWAMDRSEEYGNYYICHELAHVQCYELHKTMSHTAEYKKIEDAFLADFGLVVTRKKCYPLSVASFGKVVFESQNGS